MLVTPESEFNALLICPCLGKIAYRRRQVWHDDYATEIAARVGYGMA